VGNHGSAVDRSDETLEVPWEPQVVVTEVRNQFASTLPQTLVVRARLVTGAVNQIQPAEPLIRGCQSLDDLLGIVRATIADNKQFEFSECLNLRASDGIRKDARPVEGWNQHRHADGSRRS
jgi:hypothetical protein